jgi:hypothetical protein
LDVFVTLYSKNKYSLFIKSQQSQAPANRGCEVGKFQKAVTPEVFEVRSPYQKPVISYPCIL